MHGDSFAHVKFFHDNNFAHRFLRDLQSFHFFCLKLLFRKCVAYLIGYSLKHGSHLALTTDNQRAIKLKQWWEHSAKILFYCLLSFTSASYCSAPNMKNFSYLAGARHQRKPIFQNIFDHEQMIHSESDVVFDQKLCRKIMKPHCK